MTQREGDTPRVARPDGVLKTDPTAADTLAEVVFELCTRRGPSKTICPSEAAKAAFGPQAWRDHMNDVRQVATAMAKAGSINILQSGHVIDPSGPAPCGPIRLGLAKGAAPSATPGTND